MTNGANYKRGKLHHSPWHSDIRTPNQLNSHQCRILFHRLLQQNIDLLTVRMWWSHSQWNQLCWRNSICTGWWEGMPWWLNAHCFPRWLPKRLVIRFWIVILNIIGIVRDHAENVIKMLMVDRLCPSPGIARRWRSSSRSVAPSCHDLQKQQVISMKQLQERFKEIKFEPIVNELKHCVMERNGWYY